MGSYPLFCLIVFVSLRRVPLNIVVQGVCFCFPDAMCDRLTAGGRRSIDMYIDFEH